MVQGHRVSTRVHPFYTSMGVPNCIVYPLHSQMLHLCCHLSRVIDKIIRFGSPYEDGYGINCEYLCLSFTTLNTDDGYTFRINLAHYPPTRTVPIFFPTTYINVQCASTDRPYPSPRREILCRIQALVPDNVHSRLY